MKPDIYEELSDIYEELSDIKKNLKTLGGEVYSDRAFSMSLHNRVYGLEQARKIDKCPSCDCGAVLGTQAPKNATSQSVVDPGEGYRLLKHGEEMLGTDEYYSNNYRMWRLRKDYGGVGQQFKESDHHQTRRKMVPSDEGSGWRKLDIGEYMLKGDRYFDNYDSLWRSLDVAPSNCFQKHMYQVYRKIDTEVITGSAYYPTTDTNLVKLTRNIPGGSKVQVTIVP